MNEEIQALKHRLGINESWDTLILEYRESERAKKQLEQTKRLTAQQAIEESQRDQALLRDIQGDKTIDTYLAFLETLSTQLPAASWYLCAPSKYLAEINCKLRSLKVYFATPIVWIKENFVLSWERYHAQHEHLIFGGDGTRSSGAKSIWYGKNNESTVWQINRETASELRHPTQKPIALIARALLNSSQPRDSVYDGFGESGSTLMAYEQHDRVCCMMELEPRYVEVTCQRWEKYVNQKRVKLN
jgi:DNA modification methylase